jgi:anhydro-N-acetylmuramic acid kinase
MMSGTSVDSIDAVLCAISRRGDHLAAEVLAFDEFPIDASLRERIFRLFDDAAGSLALACSLNFEIGEAFAAAANEFIAKHRLERGAVDAIASHGQTAFHIPPHMARDSSGFVPSTLQIGEPSVIADRTGLRVVADFRVADMTLGGNGAPLVPFADWHLFSSPGQTIAVQNIGGIANCTLLPASGRIGEVVAFDTGPGNMIIDGLVQFLLPGTRYDRNGEIARSGDVLVHLLDEWMRIPYIGAPPPKTTGRELFGLQFCRSIVADNPSVRPQDLVATATAFTARSIIENIADAAGADAVRRLLLAGGGAKNTYLVDLIERYCAELMPGCTVEPLENTGFDSKARECVAFALLGYARLHGIPANVPSATGASAPALLGKIVEPPRARG